MLGKRICVYFFLWFFVGVVIIPHYTSPQMVGKGLQAEAKIGLGIINTDEGIFYKENGFYADSIEKIGIDEQLKGIQNYSFSVEVSSDGQSFLAKAISKPSWSESFSQKNTKDIWTIDQDRNLRNIVNGVDRIDSGLTPFHFLIGIPLFAAMDLIFTAIRGTIRHQKRKPGRSNFNSSSAD